MANDFVSHYELLSKLGAGGMGSVYRARDTRSGAMVAVKLLHAHLASDAAYVRRFRREAQIARSIESPNVVKVLDSGRDGDSYFLVMEYVPGKTLAQVVQERGKFPINEAVSIAAAIGLGLAAAHAKGVVHRDVSPQNVIITPEGQVKVTDFGVARDLAQTAMTATSMLLGKPEYIAPEVITGQGKPDTKSDIYALGVVLYQMLAGKVPFHASTPYAVLQKQVNEVPPALASLRQDIPEWLQATVSCCLAKRPEDRFSDPRALVTALESRQAPAGWNTGSAASGGQLPPVSPSGGSGRGRPPILPIVGGLGGLAVVFLVFGIVVAGGSSGDSEPTPTQTPSPRPATSTPFPTSTPFVTPLPTSSPRPPSTAVSTAPSIISLDCSDAIIETGTQLICNATVNGQPSQWSWSGGDSPPTGSGPSFVTTFSSYGTRQISLRVCNSAGCSGTFLSRQINVILRYCSGPSCPRPPITAPRTP